MKRDARKFQTAIDDTADGLASYRIPEENIYHNVSVNYPSANILRKQIQVYYGKCYAVKVIRHKKFIILTGPFS